MSSWSRAWGTSWGLSWGLTYEANQEDLYEIEPIHGPGVYHEKRDPRSSRDYDFLDPEYHKKRLAPKVKKVINKIARQAVQKTTQDTPKEAQESSVTSDWVDSLITLLERENIAFKRFYADLLQQQIEEQRNAQIRLQLELLGIYQQIEEEDEQAIMLMMMEL